MYYLERHADEGSILLMPLGVLFLISRKREASFVSMTFFM